MRSGIVLASALAVAMFALLVQSVALPARVVACSCLPEMPSLVELVEQGDVTVITGTVGAALPDRTPIAVESWFVGEQPAPVVWLSGGTQQMTSCDVSMKAGERRFLMLYGEPGGLYSSSSCSPNGVLGTPEGDALVAEMVAAFGEGTRPAPPEPEAQAGFDASRWLGAGIVWVIAAVGASLALFGLVILGAARRQRR